MTESQLPGLRGFNPHNIQPWTVSVVVSVTILALISVALRLFSRRIKGQPLWWDDFMIIFSMVCTVQLISRDCSSADVLQCWNLVVVGFIFAMHGCGMGIHADLLDPADIVMMAKWLVVAEVLYAFNLGWTKISILLFYQRIFGDGVTYFKRMAWGVGSKFWSLMKDNSFLTSIRSIHYGVGRYHHLPLHLHLSSSREVVVPGTAWKVHQPGCDMDRQRSVDDPHGPDHPADASASTLEPAFGETREDWSDSCVQSRILVRLTRSPRSRSWIEFAD
jgi:hypothetical protein